MTDTTKTAAMLMDEHGSDTKFHPFAAAAGVVDLDGAYAVQRDYVRPQMRSRDGRAVGYKVGLTSPRMQAMCKIDRPIAGVILEDRLHRSGVELNAAHYGRIGLEFEIAVRLGRDLNTGGGAVTIADVAAAIDAVCPAVEAVDDRHCDYATLDVLSLVVDNSWNADVVMGEFCRPWPDLDRVEGIVSLNGRPVDDLLPVEWNIFERPHLVPVSATPRPYAAASMARSPVLPAEFCASPCTRKRPSANPAPFIPGPEIAVSAEWMHFSFPTDFLFP